MKQVAPNQRFKSISQHLTLINGTSKYHRCIFICIIRTKMKTPSVYQHLFSLIMPFTITVIIPWWIHPVLIKGYFFLKYIGMVIGLVGLSGFIYTVYLF